MAIAYETSNSSTSFTCNVPSGTAEGDLLVAIVGTNNNTSTAASGPGGDWAELYSETAQSGTRREIWVGYALVTGSPPASYTWTGTNATTKRVNIHRFSGVGSLGGSTSRSQTSSTTNYADTVTPDEDGCLLVIAMGGVNTSTAGSPSGSYSNETQNSLSSFADNLLASKVQTTAAATGTVSSTGWYSAANVYQWGFNLWFKPTGGGGDPAPSRMCLLGVG